MLQLRLNVIKNLVGLVIALNLSDITYAQSNTCLIHDHNCIYHGIGRAAGVDPSQPNGINATANWDKENDFDLHSLLPQSETYSSPLEAINYPLQPTQPFFPTTDGSHIYPNHYSSTINDGGAIALHSGDDGGGVAIYPNQSGCINQTGIACENITVTGDEIPSGVYSYSLHAFSATGTEFESTNYNIDINSTGNIVLVMTEGDQTALTGVIQGAENQSETIDVFAINVGNSGHVGGVVLPQFPEISSLNELETAYQGTPNLFAEVYIPKLIEQNVLNNLQQSIAKHFQVKKFRKQVASKQALLVKAIERINFQTSQSNIALPTISENIFSAKNEINNNGYTCIPYFHPCEVFNPAMTNDTLYQPITQDYNYYDYDKLFSEDLIFDLAHDAFDGLITDVRLEGSVFYYLNIKNVEFEDFWISHKEEILILFKERKVELRSIDGIMLNAMKGITADIIWNWLLNKIEVTHGKHSWEYQGTETLIALVTRDATYIATKPAEIIGESIIFTAEQIGNQNVERLKLQQFYNKLIYEYDKPQHSQTTKEKILNYLTVEFPQRMMEINSQPTNLSGSLKSNLSDFLEDLEKELEEII